MECKLKWLLNSYLLKSLYYLCNSFIIKDKYTQI